MACYFHVLPQSGGRDNLMICYRLLIIFWLVTLKQPSFSPTSNLKVMVVNPCPGFHDVHGSHSFPLKGHALRLDKFESVVEGCEEHPVPDVDGMTPHTANVQGRPPREFTWKMGSKMAL